MGHRNNPSIESIKYLYSQSIYFLRVKLRRGTSWKASLCSMFFFVGQETDSNVVSAKSNMRSRRVVFRRSMCFVFVVASFGYFGWKSTFRYKTVSNSVDILKVPIELDSPFEQGLERSPLVEENKSSLIAKTNLTVASFSPGGVLPNMGYICMCGPKG